MEPSPPPLKTHGPTSSGANQANVRLQQLAIVRPTSIASILRPSSDYRDGYGPCFDLEFSIRQGNEEDKGSSFGSDVDSTIRSDITIAPSSKTQLVSSPLKSATKFRAFMLRFRKSKAAHFDAGDSSPRKQSGKFLVKLKEEEVSSRDARVMQPPAASSSDEKNGRIHPKDVIHKCLNKINPVCIRSPKRYGDKVKSSGQVTPCSDPGLKVVSKRLRQGGSTSAAVAAIRSPPVIEQEDGIESAIEHCRRSFNAGKGSDLALARCRSAPGTDREPIN